MKNEEERKQEINFSLDLIEGICNQCQISLFPKEVKGKYVTAIKDEITGKEYLIFKEDK
jgi:hypothetical protein